MKERKDIVIYQSEDGIGAIYALPRQAARQDTEKPDVGTTIILRLWLDRCATVEEPQRLHGVHL